MHLRPWCLCSALRNSQGLVSVSALKLCQTVSPRIRPWVLQILITGASRFIRIWIIRIVVEFEVPCGLNSSPFSILLNICPFKHEFVHSKEFYMVFLFCIKQEAPVCNCSTGEWYTLQACKCCETPILTPRQIPICHQTENSRKPLLQLFTSEKLVDFVTHFSQSKVNWS